ncbi:MAG: hypothetical protein COV74_09270 [Candidatus Omnitrophica bacterium CG11_big_fil_rev_8_21_14_0_20_45_26]|uniref:Class I SAM-dependent methyltransferase n=1 Tax=Candidatus Abzuiibacterium crystallinum TaxID=1974748 RepID=A0A2H0LLV8_9BACT|nr:MAG: hypothetical protein COV74_09270 [Candidatus Omnitrophica bacterium CG11_big_fil_rev_8_21_14_0_20_45_26]
MYHKVVDLILRKKQEILIGKSNAFFKKAKQAGFHHLEKSNNPRISIEEIPFRSEIAKLLSVQEDWLIQTYYEYCLAKANFEPLLPAVRSSRRATDHGGKSLDPHEAFALWCVIKKCKAKRILELGTRFGVSARFFRVAHLFMFGLDDSKIYSCDLNREYRYVNDDDFEFIQGDAKLLFPDILKKNKIDLIFNDAHPYDLTKISVSASLEAQSPIITFHDVGKNHPRSPFKREAYFLPVNERNLINLAEYGPWERHVMAEFFGQNLLDEDFSETDQYRVQIFDSLFGLGVAINKKYLT